MIGGRRERLNRVKILKESVLVQDTSAARGVRRDKPAWSRE